MTTHRRNYAALIPADPKAPTKPARGPYKSHARRPVPKFWRVGDALQPTPKREPVSELDWAEFLAGSLEGM
jgi:hypothetical protein